jgi:hypothetical protein
LAGQEPTTVKQQHSEWKRDGHRPRLPNCTTEADFVGEQIRIEFDGGNIRGSGTDMIELFTFAGTIEDGRVAIVKQYLGQHSVDYLGTYDGEGIMHGMWRIGLFGGKWMIKVVGHAVKTDESEIPEWRPVAKADAGFE